MNFYQSIKYRMKGVISPYPRIFIPAYSIIAMQQSTHCLISKRTEIVIEGFPRSANTFSVVAFTIIQKKLGHVAHHLHAEAQILEGVRRELPVIVLIREPNAAIQSLLIRHPEISIQWAFNRYITFYSTVSKVVDHVVIAPFYEVTNDYGEIIKKVNTKFGKEYVSFDHTPKNVAIVFDEIEKINKKLYDGNETFIARPSKKREVLLDQVDFLHLVPDKRRKKAMDVYNSLCEAGSKQG